MSNNIYPIWDKALGREEREKLLHQQGMVIWLSGLSGSGKSTIAMAVEYRLNAEGYMTMLLDGDNMRAGLNANLSFSDEDRKENTRRVAEVAKLFAHCGIITLCSFVSPTEEIRNQVKAIVGDDFHSVYVNAPYEVCEARDVKGLYAKARRGEIKNFTGLDAPFEPPVNPALEIKTADQELSDSADLLFDYIISQQRRQAED